MVGALRGKQGLKECLKEWKDKMKINYDMFSIISYSCGVVLGFVLRGVAVFSFYHLNS